jgi:hypothetical protein
LGVSFELQSIFIDVELPIGILDDQQPRGGHQSILNVAELVLLEFFICEAVDERPVSITIFVFPFEDVELGPVVCICGDDDVFMDTERRNVVCDDK